MLCRRWPFDLNGCIATGLLLVLGLDAVNVRSLSIGVGLFLLDDRRPPKNYRRLDRWPILNRQPA